MAPTLQCDKNRHNPRHIVRRGAETNRTAGDRSASFFQKNQSGTNNIQVLVQKKQGVKNIPIKIRQTLIDYPVAA
jgi:hypothetical protein